MPPAVGIKVVPSFRELNGRFARANEGLLEGRRDLMRVQGRRFKELAQQEAPSRTGEFKGNIRFRTFVQAEALGFTVSSPEPLSTFIQKGTVAHEIVPRFAKVLRFTVGAAGAAGAFGGLFAQQVVFTQRVSHPGTKANPFMGRAMRRWIPGARRDLRRIGLNWVRTLRGKETRAKI